MKLRFNLDWLFAAPVAEAPPAVVAPVVLDRRLLDEVCDWVRGGSQVDPATLAAMTLMVEDARLLAEAFAGETGRKRLMILARMTVLRPPVDMTRPAADREAYAYIRQGQDSVFAGVLRYLDIHDAQQRTEEHERSHPVQSRPDAGADERFTADGGFDPAGLVAGR